MSGTAVYKYESSASSFQLREERNREGARIFPEEVLRACGWTNPSMKLPLFVFGVLLSSIGFAQMPGNPSVAPANVPLRPVIAEDPAQLRPPQFEIAVGWNDRTKDKLSVPLTNASDKPLQVLGVQATRGIFIVDYPNKIKAKGDDLIDFIYDAADNTDGDMEVIRVKTDQGIKLIHVQIKRSAVFNFDTRELRWKVGGKADTKTVTLKVPDSQVAPKRAKSSSGGHTAEIEKVDGTTFRIKVTPSSTDKATQFAVAIEFDQPLPGVAPVIMGVVGE